MYIFWTFLTIELLVVLLAIRACVKDAKYYMNLGNHNPRSNLQPIIDQYKSGHMIEAVKQVLSGKSAQ